MTSYSFQLSCYFLLICKIGYLLVLFPKRKLIYIITWCLLQICRANTNRGKNKIEKTKTNYKSSNFSQQGSVHWFSTSHGMQFPICTRTKRVLLHPFFSIIHINDHFTPTISDEFLPHPNSYCLYVRLKKYLMICTRAR